MSSRMRPETSNAPLWKRAPDRFDSFWMIRDSVRRHEDGLAFGALHNKGLSCAIGSFFDDNPNLALHVAIIDEVAAYNDSIPKHIAPKTRRRKVLTWLNAKIEAMRGRK